MSWSVNLVGTPKGVVERLDAVGEQMQDGQSKEEFMDAKPHLQGLVGQVVGNVVKLVASGHANFNAGPEGKQVKTFGNISVSLDCFYGEFCQ